LPISSFLVATVSTYILGISAYYHDSAAALIRDGEIIAAAHEERFTRRKGDARFPGHAIAYCLEEAGIAGRQLEHVAFYEKPLSKFERLLETYLAFAPKGFQSFKKALPLWAKTKLHIPEEIRFGLGDGFKGEIYCTDHHESHAASAFFPSPFEEATILTLDAVGEWGTSSLGIGRSNKIELTHEMRFPHSLGMLYSAFTYYAGFQVNSGEYKLMGLAPYGVPKYTDLIWDNLMQVAEDGSVWLDMTYFNYCHGLTMTSERFHDLFGGPPRKPESFLTQKDMDIAASIQKVCEEIVLRVARHAHKLMGLKNLVMAGGVALNCVANGRLLREGPFEKVWVQPAAGDAGGALGAALLIWHHFLGQARRVCKLDSQKGSFLGPSFKNEDIRLFLDSAGAVYEYVEDEATLNDRVASMMADGKIVGWFHGRMEYGPRSLGARSIIGDARSPEMQQAMNLKIKFRESFRPFAPCVLREYATDYFEMRPGEESPYMLFVAPLKESHRLPLTESDRQKMQDPDLRIRVAVPRSTVPAITHVDYSARIQTVDAERHGRFYRLMRRFYELTGCPVIVNTSFNIRGEPIVCTFEEAYRCFMATEIDCLVLEDFIVLKVLQPANPLHDPQIYKAQYALD
jgi:carbamoyltransferase